MKALFILLLSSGMAMAGALPTLRTGQWLAGTQVGVDGGIPDSSKMTVSATILSGATAATINSAIAACPSNQVVQLSAGTYSSSSIINLKSGVVLRGAGMSNTVFNFSGSGGIQGNGAPIYGAIANNTVAGSANWTGGYTQGGSNITVSSTSGMSVGMIIALDQLNDNIDMMAQGYEEVGGMGRGPNTRSQEQYAVIKAINGTTVTIWPPISAPNWRLAMSPQVWWITGWIQRAGIENMTINGQNSGGVGPNYANVYLYGCANCWVKNCRTLYGYWTHINPYGGFRCEVRHCLIEGTQGGASQSYGIVTAYAGSCLFEDNIFNAVAGPMMSGACENNCVWSFNYATNHYYVTPGWNMPSHWYHRGGATMALGEGNHGTGTTADYIHGPMAYCVDFRNRWTNWQPWTSGGGQTTADMMAICLFQTNHYFAAVGNILGTAGKVSTYWRANTSYGNAIFAPGVYNGGYGVSQGDIGTVNTLYVDANYDTVNASIQYNATNVDHSMPNSYVYLNKPAWFGDLNWPAFNPTNTSAAALSPTNIPAGYRFWYGVDPPFGGGNPLPPSNLSIGKSQLGKSIL